MKYNAGAIVHEPRLEEVIEVVDDEETRLALPHVVDSEITEHTLYNKQSDMH